MGTSLRFQAGLPALQRLLEETDIAEQPTVRMPSVRETDRLPPIALFHIDEKYPLVAVKRAIEQWMQRSKVPPVCIKLSPKVLQRYWQEVLHLQVYYYRFPNGRLWIVELQAMDSLPDSVVYCSAKRV
jgi:hypothetical protein